MNISFVFRFSRVRRNIYQHISSKCSHFIPPENIRKPTVFLLFPGGIKEEDWKEMGYLVNETCSAQGLSLLFCVGSVQ